MPWRSIGLEINQTLRPLDKPRGIGHPKLQTRLKGLATRRFAGDDMDIVTDRSWIAILTLVLLLLSTVALWFRFRRLPSLRPWLKYHIIGNVVLAIGLFATWSFDLDPFYYWFIMFGIFAIWIWGTRKLRASLQQNK
jgi:hypothetical protein